MEKSSPGQIIELDCTRQCPVCENPGTPMFAGADRLVLEGRDFSPRKPPAKVTPSYLRCHPCGLAYASPTLRPSHSSYWARRAHGGEKSLEALAARAYVNQASRLGVEFSRGKRVGEWGCASGYFLELAQESGCEVWGVEPCLASRAMANPKLRPFIRPQPEAEGKPSDIIGIFQTLEHVFDPVNLLRRVWKALSPGGQLLIACHDMDSWGSRLLGKRSPLYDVQHFQVFSEQGIRQLLLKAGFEQVQVTALKNRYPLSYWMKLLRLGPLADWIAASGIDPSLSLRAGNLMVSARRSANHREESERFLTPTGT